MGKDPEPGGFGDALLTVFVASFACLLWITQLIVTPLGYPAGKSAQQNINIFLIEVAATIVIAAVALLRSRWWWRRAGRAFSKSHGEPPAAGAGVTANLPTRPPVISARYAQPLPIHHEEPS